MVVVAVRPDELTVPVEPAPRPRRELALVPVVALGVLVALLVALLARPAASAPRDDTQAVLAAARQEAVNLTTIDYRSAAADLTRIIDAATGRLRTQFAAERNQVAALTAGRSTSTGSVLSAGLVSLDTAAGTARVVVAADATVTTHPVRGAGQSALKHYRMVLTLQRVGPRWLVRDVAFAGVPG